LENAGLVSVQQKGQEKRYTLTPEPLSEADRWIKRINEKWDKRLARLKEFVEKK
jgi:hypothetical protein